MSVYKRGDPAGGIQDANNYYAINGADGNPAGSKNPLAAIASVDPFKEFSTVPVPSSASAKPATVSGTTDSGIKLTLGAAPAPDPIEIDPFKEFPTVSAGPVPSQGVIPSFNTPHAAVNAPSNTVNRYNTVGENLGIAGAGAWDYLKAMPGQAIHNLTNALGGGYQTAAGGLGDILKGQYLPSVSYNPNALAAPVDTGETDLFGQPVMHPPGQFPAGLSVNPGGVAGTALGIAGIIGSPITSLTKTAVEDPVTQLTGSPSIGERVGAVANTAAMAPFGKAAIGNAADSVAAKAAGVQPWATNVARMLHQAGRTPEDAFSELKARGPTSALVDLDPALETDATGLARRGGDSTSILKGKMNARLRGADDAVSSMVNSTLGPAPDANRILSEIRGRKAVADAVGAPETAKAALDTMMGQAKDPATVLSDMLDKRGADARPLYKKALDRPVAWDNRLQEFLDDPIVKSGIAKGVKIQRLESLASGEPFNPVDYAIKDFDAAGDPIIGDTPNMRTLNVVKKGLDAMVGDAKDPITGRLSEEGRAIDGVRRAFLTKLDKINPDYAAARQAWAGPTVTQEAFNRGLNIFRNSTGANSVNSTPGALTAFLKDASDGEKEAVKAGARSAFQQQMANAADPAAKAELLASKGATQQKLAAILGKDEADSLVKQLTFKYEDPVGEAFSKGMGIFKNREGVQGLEDTPQALGSWLKNASEEEVSAHREGVRQAIEQSLNSARRGDYSQAVSLFGKSGSNRAKLEAVYPGASDLFDALDNKVQEVATSRRVATNSVTNEAERAQEKYRPKVPTAVGAGPFALGALAAHLGGQSPEIGALVGGAARYGYNKLAEGRAGKAADSLASGTANALAATGDSLPPVMQEVAKAYRHLPEVKARTSILAAQPKVGWNALTDYLNRAVERGSQLGQIIQ